MLKSLSILLLFFLLACDREGSPSKERVLLIERISGDTKRALPENGSKPLPVYSWERGKESPFPMINKEFFRCMGSKLHPPKREDPKLPPLSDCDGFLEHSLPIKNGEEFVYPCLIELLNEIQNRTKHQVIVTSGHRCLKHHLYVKLPEERKAFKHLMGAEVSFYVKGLEKNPEAIHSALSHYYSNHSLFKGDPTFELKQSDKDDLQVVTRPYLNKEILVKLYLPEEGRDGDNSHALPYFRIQVRWDRDTKKNLPFRWDEAEKNLLQW